MGGSKGSILRSRSKASEIALTNSYLLTELEKTWLKLNSMSHKLRRLLIGETDPVILELKKALDIVEKTADIIKKRIEK